MLEQLAEYESPQGAAFHGQLEGRANHQVRRGPVNLLPRIQKGIVAQVNTYAAAPGFGEKDTEIALRTSDIRHGVGGRTEI
jgi:hypothetical protein